MDDWTRLAYAAQGGADARPDGGALDAFVRATRDDVWRLCAHLGDRDRADDLTQETYVRVLRSLPGFRGDSPVRSWLFSIARRVVADDIADRQRRRGRRWETAPLRTESPDHQDTVALEHLLSCLSPDRYAALVLTQLMGYSYAEAAEACAVPVGTIRSRVARARSDLMAHADEPAARDELSA